MRVLLHACKVANECKSFTRFFSRGLTRRNRGALVFLWRTAYSAFVSRTLFFTVYLVEAGVTWSQTATRNRAKIWQFSRRRFCRSHAGPLFIRIRGKNNPRFSYLFSRGEKIRGLEYCVYKSTSLHRCSSCGGKWCSPTIERERDTVEIDCERSACLGWSAVLDELLPCSSSRRKNWDKKPQN